MSDHLQSKIDALKLKEEAEKKRLEQLKNQRKQLEAQQRKKENELTRQLDTRRKILLGAFLLDIFKERPDYKNQLKSYILEFAQRPESEKARDLNLKALENLFK